MSCFLVLFSYNFLPCSFHSHFPNSLVKPLGMLFVFIYGNQMCCVSTGMEIKWGFSLAQVTVCSALRILIFTSLCQCNLLDNGCIQKLWISHGSFVMRTARKSSGWRALSLHSTTSHCTKNKLICYDVEIRHFNKSWFVFGLKTSMLTM